MGGWERGIGNFVKNEEKLLNSRVVNCKMSNLEKDLAKIHERASGLLWVIGEEDIKVERIIAPGETSRGKYDQRTHYEVHIRVRSDREEWYRGLGTIKLLIPKAAYESLKEQIERQNSPK